MHEPITTSQVAIHGGLAFFGAITHALNAHRRGESKTIPDFIALAVMSSFTGVIFAIIGLHFFEHQLYVSMALAGTGGFLGVEGMAMLGKWLPEMIQKMIQKK